MGNQQGVWSTMAAFLTWRWEGMREGNIPWRNKACSCDYRRGCWQWGTRPWPCSSCPSLDLLPVLPLVEPNFYPEGQDAHWCSSQGQPLGHKAGWREESGQRGKRNTWIWILAWTLVSCMTLVRSPTSLSFGFLICELKWCVWTHHVCELIWVWTQTQMRMIIVPTSQS